MSLGATKPRPRGADREGGGGAKPVQEGPSIEWDDVHEHAATRSRIVAVVRGYRPRNNDGCGVKRYFVEEYVHFTNESVAYLKKLEV